MVRVKVKAYGDLQGYNPQKGEEFIVEIKGGSDIKNLMESLGLPDFVHAVLPTRLNLRDFYQEFSDLYKSGYLYRGLGWKAFAFWVRKLISFLHLLRMIRSFWVMGNVSYYLSGHKGL
jgi:hypothetical protein